MRFSKHSHQLCRTRYMFLACFPCSYPKHALLAQGALLGMRAPHDGHFGLPFCLLSYDCCNMFIGSELMFPTDRFTILQAYNSRILSGSGTSFDRLWSAKIVKFVCFVVLRKERNSFILQLLMFITAEKNGQMFISFFLSSFCQLLSPNF